MTKNISDLLGSGTILEHNTKLWIGFDIRQPGKPDRHLALWGPKDSGGGFSRVQAKAVNKPARSVIKSKLREGYSQKKAGLTFGGMQGQLMTAAQMQNLLSSSALEELTREFQLGAAPPVRSQPFEIKEIFTDDFESEEVPW